jgi:hypothetical protein
VDRHVGGALAFGAAGCWLRQAAAFVAPGWQAAVEWQSAGQLVVGVRQAAVIRAVAEYRAPACGQAGAAIDGPRSGDAGDDITYP